MDDVGLMMAVTVMTVMTVVSVMTEVLNPDDIVFAMVGMAIQLCLMSVVVVLVESGLMARLNIMPMRLSRRHLNNSWVMMSLKLWMGNRTHESLFFHFSRSLSVPNLPLCKPS